MLSGDDLTSYAFGRCHDQLRIVLSLADELEVPPALGERVPSSIHRPCSDTATWTGSSSPRDLSPNARTSISQQTAHRELLIETPVNVLVGGQLRSAVRNSADRDSRAHGRGRRFVQEPTGIPPIWTTLIWTA